ncbi:acyl-CoA thioesterase [Actinomadura kijaniata]|uniref:acyl-CoA thioesterase n=1 Tax=Actinomadura kijaniata TaxID=46161 RepID=UPI003F19C412
MNRHYEYRHVVDFKETDVVGNVYHANYVRWQQRCCGMFLLEHASDVLGELGDDLKLVTVDSECDHLSEVTAFEEVAIRLRLEELTPDRIDFAFDYVRVGPDAEELVARGRQRVVCMREGDGATATVPVPERLRRALEGYTVRRSPHAPVVGTGGRA